MLAPSAVCTIRKFLYSTRPPLLTLISGFLKTPLAIPPMWKVRMVNWVPGSPIDCAAMIPTDEPRSTIELVAGLIPYSSAVIPTFLRVVNAESTLTFSMPTSSILWAMASVIISPFLTIISSGFNGFLISLEEQRPTMRSKRLTISSSPSKIADFQIPERFPSSYASTMQSIATSQSLRVMYPASAVLRAVSARPLRAPWVEIKYSRTDNPSRKEERIGRSIISPEGLAIKPRVPHNCLTCCLLPLAPESIIKKTGLTASCPEFSFNSSNTAFAISSVVPVQISIILL